MFKRIRPIILSIVIILIVPLISFASAEQITVEVSREEYESNYKNDTHYSLLEQKTYYRYQTRKKETKQSGNNTLSGYTKYDSKSTSTTSGYVCGEPISTTTTYTSTSKVTKSAVNKGYYYYAYTVANPNNPADWTYYADTSRANCISHIKNAGFNAASYAEGRLRYFWYISTKDLGNLSPRFNSKIPYCEDSNVKKGVTTKSGDHLYDLKLYKYSKCYKVKTDTVTNYFYKYSNWSEWSDWTTEYRTGDSNLLKTESKVMCVLQYTPDEVCEHEWNTYYTTDIEPTCTSYGVESLHCAKCNAIKEKSQRNVSPKAHTWSSGYTVEQDASCDEAGYEARHCLICNTIKTDSIRIISAKGHEWGPQYTIKTATLYQKGLVGKTCKRCGLTQKSEVTHSPESKTNINAVEVSDIKVKTYNGKKLTPKPAVTYQGRTLKRGKDYVLTYKKNVKPGEATITIRGKGAFSGKKTVRFSIEMKNAKIKSIRNISRNGKKYVAVRWKRAGKKGSKLIKGYEYRISMDKTFKKHTKTEQSVGADILGVNIPRPKFKNKGKYFVQIRIIFKDGKRSEWSPAKSIRVK